MRARDDKPQLYIDLFSQPSRACVIFCQLNRIEVEIHYMSIAKGDTKTSSYRELNGLGKVGVLLTWSQELESLNISDHQRTQV